MLASLLALLLVRWVSDPIPGFTGMVAIWLACSLAATSAGLLISSSYKDVRRFATVRSMAKTAVSVIIKEALLALVPVFGLLSLSAAYSVLAILTDLFLTGGMLMYIRLSARIMAADKTDIKEIAGRRSALVVGTGKPSLTLATELEKEGYAVVGLMTQDRSLSGRVISDHVVYTCNSKEELAHLQWQLGGVDCVFFPHSEEISALGIVPGEDIPQKDGMSMAGHIFKRGFDIAFSGGLLLVFLPLIGICTLLVKLEDGGPVIYAQERIGLGGKPFKISKFRSMRTDAEKNGSPALYSGEEDPRLTKIGKFLRTHHLDELPQLWNVFKGDMSFIGYRPERQYYIDQIMECNARYCYLYQIRPGVTSYATLYNGYTDTLEKMLTRLDLDLYYLRNHSVWFDVKVLGLTFLSIVSGKKF